MLHRHPTKGATLSLTLQDLRVQAITRSLFSAPSLAEAIAALGFLQADPIRAPARAQDLILRHRVAGYRAGDLERDYAGLDLEEDVLHVYGFLPRSRLHLLHPREGAWGVERDFPGLAEQVLEFVRLQGEADHRQLEKQWGKMRVPGTWGGQAKATTRVLELLHYRGWLRVACRDGNLRRYVPATPPEPQLDPDERLRQLVLLLAGQYAPITLTTLRDVVARLRFAAPSLADHGSAIRRLVQSGDLEAAEVEGVTYLWPAGEQPYPGQAEVRDEVRWLAPFDPIVWDRTRFEHLWGWPYRFEAYTPAAARRWGYYALPMLWRERIVGWANVAVKDGRLQVDLGFVDGASDHADRAFETALQAERARMAAFLRLE
jgi:uncharacterized protein